MLTFLRKIRRSLIESGSARKYFLYAIGEIALVVIGILIALQINNWNEDRKDKKVQFRLLKELHVTAGEDYLRNHNHVRRNKESLASLEIVINHLERKLPFHDSLSHHFAMAHSRWISQVKDNAYENIKEHGLDFIENDTTRNHLTHLYENRIELFHVFDTRFDQFFYQIAVPELINSFNDIFPQGTIRGEMFPLDYNSLSNNMKYLNILKATRSHMRQYTNWQERTILDGMGELQQRLEAEMMRY